MAMRTGAKWAWVTAGVVGFVIAAFAGWSAGTKGRAFDPAAWRDERRLLDGKRLEMADEIVARKMLSGKTRAQVVEMLGEPPETQYFRAWDMVYRLGNERGFISIDSEWLVVKLDAQGKVSEYRIVRD
jgi:outer membrane protein assembly factor BamE (lipoprotein component of BamABCDE complex)